MSIAWEQLRRAVHTLAEAGPQRERLTRAFVDHLTPLRPKDVPAEIRDDFVALIAALPACRSGRDATAVHSRLAALDDATVRTMTVSIIAMYDAVARYEPIPMLTAHPHRDR
jgi:hypothetical protein